MSCSFFSQWLDLEIFVVVVVAKSLVNNIFCFKVNQLINSRKGLSWKLLVCSWRFISALWPLLKYKCYLTSCRICAIRAIHSWYHPSGPFRGIFHCFTIFFDNFIALFIEMICCYGWKVSAGLGDTKLTIFE